MKTILVCQKKGGAGKTLMADEIAFALERDGFHVNFIDLDRQGGCLHKNTSEEDAYTDELAVQVVDTPAGLNMEFLDWYAESDFIVIPTKLTVRDQNDLEDMVEIMGSQPDKKPVLYILNGWNRFLTANEFEQWFASAHPECRYSRLSQSELFNRAASYNESVVEYKKNSEPAKQIESIYSIIKYELGLNPKKHYNKKDKKR